MSLNRRYLVDDNIVADLIDLIEVNDELGNERFTRNQLIALFTITDEKVLFINDFTIRKFND
jgi:hypothetical protein